MYNVKFQKFWISGCDRCDCREDVNFDHYGIDEEGPVTDVQSEYAVSGPDTITTLTHNQELSLQEARNAVLQTGDHDGIIAFHEVSFYLNCCS